MTRVGWLADQGAYVGGAELTQAEFRAAAPDGVEVVDCPPGAVDPGCDAYAIHNSITYDSPDIEVATSKPAYRYWNDVGGWYPPEMRELLDSRTQAICCSRLQAEYMGLRSAVLIPPPIDTRRFEDAAVEGPPRHGAVCIASWRNAGKAPRRATEWAAGNGGIDFYGSGPFAPATAREVPYGEMPRLLAHYKTFVFLPAVIEPFGRSVAEAYAAGLEIVTNGLVGAREWILGDFTKVTTAAADYWELVLS